MNSPERLSPEILSPEEHLARIGLSPESFRGKKILVLHAGKSPLGEDTSQYGADFMTDFDPAWDEVEDDQLPFKSPRFDFVVANEGVLRNDPNDPAMLDLFREAVRVCTEGGQIRVYDPFQGFDMEEGDPVQLLKYSLQDINGSVDVELVKPDNENKLARPYLIATKLTSAALS